MEPWELYKADSSQEPWELYKSGDSSPSSASQTKPFKVGAEGMPEAIRQTMQNYGPLAKTAMGTYSALDDAAMRLKQLTAENQTPLMVGGFIVPETVRNFIEEKRKGVSFSKEDEQAARANRVIREDPWAIGGNVLGSVIGTAGIGGPGIPSAIGLGTGLGYLGSPVLDNESGAARAAQGAVLGGASNVGMRLLTGSPIIPQTAATRELFSRGVAPTPGQQLQSNPSGIAQMLSRLEEKAQSFPLIGDAITQARQTALKDWRLADINRALPEGAKPITHTGIAGINALRESIGNAYDDVYRGVTVKPDVQMTMDMINARYNSRGVPLNAERQQQYEDILKKVVFDRLSPTYPKHIAEKGLPAATVKKTVEKSLSDTAFKLSGPTQTVEANALGEAVYGARDAVRNMMARNINDPQKLATLAELNAKYPLVKSLQKAAESAKARNYEWSPFELQRATLPNTVNRASADVAQSVLPTRVPNTFTTDRAMLGGALGYGATAGLGAAIESPLLIGAMAAPLAYTRTGSRWLSGATSPESFQMLAPYASRAGTAGLLDIFDRPIQ